MNIELRKWSVEDKEVLIKMCNSIDRSFLSDRLPNPYTNASAEWWLTMVKDNEGHGFHNEENKFDFYRAMEKFLDAHLKK